MSKCLEIKYCNDCPFVKYENHRPFEDDDQVRVVCDHPDGKRTYADRKRGRQYEPYGTCPLPNMIILDAEG